MGYRRHIKALMHKNCINWKRTPFGSLFEIILPILCMSALCYYKQYEQPEVVDEETLLHYAYAQYPVTQLIGINWWPIKN